MTDWKSSAAPGGHHLTIRDVERGAAAVAIDADKEFNVGFVVPADQRQDAARALAGENYIVVRVDQLDKLEADLRAAQERLRRTGPFEYVQ